MARALPISQARLLRRFRVAASAALLAAACACSRHGATGVSVDKALNPYIPPDTKAIVEVRFDKLKATPFYSKHQKQFNLPQVDAMAERTGFDPRRDLTDVLVTWNGTQALAMARGHFDQQKIERALGPEAQGSFVFLPRNILLAGPGDVVSAAKQRQSAGGGGVPDQLKPRLASIPSGDEIWAASYGPLPTEHLPLRSDIESALSNIVEFVNGTAMGVGFDTGVHVQADISCISDAGAKRVNDGIRGSIGLARLMTRDNEADLLRLWDSVHVAQDRDTVHLRMDLEAGLADRIFDRMSELRGRAGALVER